MPNWPRRLISSARRTTPQGLAILSPFRKEIEGRPLHLVAASFPQELSLVTSCLLFDFDAEEPIDPESRQQMAECGAGRGPRRSG